MPVADSQVRSSQPLKLESGAPARVKSLIDRMLNSAPRWDSGRSEVNV